MKRFHRIQNSSLWVKVFHWEYWPAYLFNIPVIFIWLWFSLRARSLFFFSRVNPAIPTGGVLSESKIGILDLIAEDFKPLTLFLPFEEKSVDESLRVIQSCKIPYPLIFKPDIGERGKRVSIIRNRSEALEYLGNCSFDLIVQEYISYPKEMSLMYHRFPRHKKGIVTSVCLKEALSVAGDGVSTIDSLLEVRPRARFQKKRLYEAKAIDPELILKKNESLVLEPIGNHCRGTKFLNGNGLIDDELTNVFDNVHKTMDGAYYGRFDLKYTNIEELKRGENFCIVEFNGISSEPAHIYDPSNRLWKAYQDIYKHWAIIYKLSLAQKKAGIKNMNLGDAIDAFRVFFANKKALQGSL